MTDLRFQPLPPDRPRQARPQRAGRVVDFKPYPLHPAGHRGPRVVMRPSGWAHSQRRRARRQLVTIYVLLALFSLYAYATRPRPAVAEPSTRAHQVGGHVFLLATPTPVPMTAAPLPAVTSSRLWQGFSPTVLYWEPLIIKWADHYGLDPNQAAVIMQVESCGDPEAISPAGARGLFQVMPFHNAAGEDPFDPDTNAMRGLAYFADRLTQTGGDVGRAFAGYNGGQRAAASSWDQWPAETQRYYLWSTGIMAELQQGKAESETLNQWLRAGGSSLCRQASERLGL